MSLIHDALRKARKEAAERDAEERGSTYVPPRSHLPSPRSSWIPGLVVGLLVGVGVAFLLVIALRAPVAGPTDEPPDEPQAFAPESSSGERTVEPVVEPPAESGALDATPAPMPPPIEPDEAETEEPPPETSTETSPRDQAETTPDEQASEDAEAAPDPDLPDARPTELRPDQPRLVTPPERIGAVGAPADRTFVLEAEVDGRRLELDFIVWSSREPFAQINRQQVTVGQAVDGFVVRRIERERVVLEGEGGLVTLRVR